MIFSKANGLNDTIYGKSQDPIRMFLEEEEEAYKKGSQIEEIFQVIKSDRYGEKFSSFTSKGDFQPVGEAGAYPRTSQQVGFEKFIEPETWKLSFEVTEEMIEDSNMLDMKAKGSDFMLSYARTREKFAANFLNNGANTSFLFGGKTFDYTCADGKALFDTAHPSKTGETANQSNKGNAVFSYDNLMAAEEAMQKIVDDNGNLMNIQPDTIIIPNNSAIKKLVANAVFTTAGAPEGNNNHSFNIQQGRWNIIVWNQLSKGGATNDPWYLMDSKRAKIDGLMFIDRVPLNVRSWIDDETGNNVWGGRARFGAGAVNWRSFYASIPA